MLRKRESMMSDDIFFSDESEKNDAGGRSPFPNLPVLANAPKNRKADKNFRKARQLVDLYHNEVRQNFNERKHSANHQSDELLKELHGKFLEKVYPEAIDLCHEIILKYPSLTEPYHILHLIYEETGDRKRASDFLFIKLQLEKSNDPDIWHQWYELGNRYFELEEFRSAIYCFTRAFRKNCAQADILLRKAECYERLDAFGKSLQVYERYLNLDPSNKALLKKVARLYASMGKRVKSLTILLRLLSTDDFILNSDLNVLNMVLDIFIKLKQYDFAIAFLELFVTESESFSRISRTLYHKLEGKESKDIESLFELSGLNKISAHEMLTSDQILYFLENLPIDLTFAYIKSLIFTGRSEQFFALMDRIGRESLLSYEDLFSDFFASLIESKNPSLIKHEMTAFKQLFEKLTTKEKIEFLLFESEHHRLFGKLRDQLSCLTQILKIDPKQNKARMRLSRIFQRKRRPNIALEVLNQDDAASKLSARLRVLNENLSMLSAERFSKDNDSGMLEEFDAKKKGKIKPQDKRLVTKLTMLKVFNKELIDMIGSRIAKINRAYNKDDLLIKNERIKLVSEGNKDERYFSTLEKLIVASLSLENERCDLNAFLKQKLLLESNKDLMKSLLHLYEKGKGVLIYSHKKRKQVFAKSPAEKEVDENELLFNERELILRKKKFFVKKLIRFFLGEIFSFVDFIGLSGFKGYLEELLRYFLDKQKLESARKILGLFLSTRESALKNIQERACWKLKYFVICCKQNCVDKALVCLRQLTKDLIEFSDGKWSEAEMEFRETTLKLILTYFNSLLPSVKDHTLLNISYLLKILKHFLHNNRFNQNEELRTAVQMTIANFYFFNNSFDLALKYYRECKNNSSSIALASLMSSVCMLVKTASRSNFDKRESIKACLEEFKIYADKKDSSDDLEVKYNLGRSLAFVGDIRHATDIFHGILDELEARHISENNQNMNRDFKLKIFTGLNLYSIYQHTNNKFLRKQVVDRYLTFN